MNETNRRREKQQAYNEKNGIVPKALNKKVADILELGQSKTANKAAKLNQVAEQKGHYSSLSPQELDAQIKTLETEMYDYAQNLEFEKAAETRDKIHILRQQFIANS